MNTFSLIKAHKTLLSIAVLFFFTIQPILSSVLVLAENTVVVIDIDNDTEKEGENKNKQEKELSEEKKITTYPGSIAIVFSDSSSCTIPQAPIILFGSVFLEIPGPPPRFEM